MTLYMDVHDSLPEGTTAADVAAAHTQDRRCREVRRELPQVLGRRGRRQGLVPGQAPDPLTAATVHREAHGLVADRIFPVVEGQ